MLSKVFSGSVLGVDPYLVEIEVDCAGGLPIIIVVGLPDEAVKESKDRVKAAIHNSDFEFPSKRITINLAPADVRKEGVGFELPMALGILASTGQIESSCFAEYIFLGELSLDGKVRPVKGVLPVALGMQRWGKKKIVVPKENACEAGIVEGIDVYPVASLAETVKFLKKEAQINPVKSNFAEFTGDAFQYEDDFADVKGQHHVKRALEVAAAGGHNAILIGPPGSGKTMLARRMPSIIPDMTMQEALETTKIHSVAGLLREGRGIIRTRPFRSPHHSISCGGLVGGGSYPVPGEASISHNGILFLDELPEFRRDALEALRQPLEDKEIFISRTKKSVVFPSNFTLICAMNPCPCGFFSDPKNQCRCTPAQIKRYISKISGPLLDRIDIHVDVPSLKYRDLSKESGGDSSAVIRARVNKARKIQHERFKNERTTCNALMKSKQIKKYCDIGEEGHAMLRDAQDRLGMSARGFDKVLKVARTIADLDFREKIEPKHLAEAVQYRTLDRNLWN